MKDELDHCRGCGAKRPADAPPGLCPACLLKAGLLGEGSVLPDVTIIFGPASSSVLVPGTPCLNDQRFIPFRLGAMHAETPKRRKSDWLVVSTDWMPACRYVAARSVSSSRLRPDENC